MCSFPGVFLHSGVTGAWPATTALVIYELKCENTTTNNTLLEQFQIASKYPKFSSTDTNPINRNTP